MHTQLNTSSHKNLFRTQDCFFVIASDRLDEVETHLYGYALEGTGIFEQENIGQWTQDRFGGTGNYVFIKKTPEKIVISQDFNGGMGLLLYRSGDYYAISNSFYLLLDYLKDKKPLTPDLDYMKQLLATYLSTLAYPRTAIREIELVPSNAVLTIDAAGALSAEKIDYKFNALSLDSEEGMRQLDLWHNKWEAIIRGIAAQTDELRVDLTGGFDSRLVFSFFVSAGIDLRRVCVHSINDTLHNHAEDYRIASAIAEKLGFQLNRGNPNPDPIRYSPEDVLAIEFHSKMLFHKELSFSAELPPKKRYYFGGFGGETIRPYWDMPPEELIRKEQRRIAKLPKEAFEDYAGAIERVVKDTIRALEETYGAFDPDTHSCGLTLYRGCRCRQHFGNINTEAYTHGTLKLSPALDPLIQQLRQNDDECKDKNLLIALIFQRYCPQLLEFPFEGGRAFSESTLAHAAALNEKYARISPPAETPPFSIGSDDIPVERGNGPLTAGSIEQFFLDVFRSPAFRLRFCALFGAPFYSFIEDGVQKSNYYPLRDVYSAVACMEVIRIAQANRAMLSTGFKEDMDDMAESFAVSIESPETAPVRKPAPFSARKAIAKLARKIIRH